jgi:hypothetical protein
LTEVVLRLDEASARDLLDTIYAVGEHVAAGAPIQQDPPDVVRRMAAVQRELEGQLGIESIGAAMQRAMDEKRP